MVDNPTKFIIFILIVVVLLVSIITVFSSAKNNKAEVNQENIPSSKSQNTEMIEGISENPAVYDAIVDYTDSGFSPATIEIKSGATIRFINKSSDLMRISSIVVMEKTTYGEFTQERAIKNGDFFDLNFSKQGDWLYQNLNDKSKTGIVIVK